MHWVTERLGAAGFLRGAFAAAMVFGGSVGCLILVTVVAFAADEVAHEDRVARNVSVAGQDVSSTPRASLGEVLTELERSHATRKVVVEGRNGGGFVTQAEAVGLRVNPSSTAGRVMAVGRTGSPAERWWSWLGSFASTRRSGLALSVDRGAVAQVVTEKGQPGENPPAEASIQIGPQGKLEGVAGRAGEGIDPTELADDLVEAAAKDGPIKVKARRGGLGPRFTKSDADELAERAEAVVATPLPLVAETTTAILSSRAMRILLSSTPGATGLELRVDEAAAAAAAAKALAAAGTPVVEPTFKVDASGSITLVPGAPGRVCCGPEAGKAVADAILQRPEKPLALDLVVRAPRLTDEQAGALGVTEEVSSFATRHACCQPRVTNIHRIADLIRGQVIPPGQSFSVNDFVGERTTDKGFVVDKVISEGRYQEDVGGGVSQFATTLFNAAWFAGLEFGEYQSHSLAIGRYPKGREATLGFPHPDLVIKNTSPRGVMIWPTYTNRELRITLYSTKWVEVKPDGQDARSNGACTLYTTKRQRTFLDGRVVKDSTIAQYRSGEGQLCG